MKVEIIKSFFYRFIKSFNICKLVVLSNSDTVSNYVLLRDAKTGGTMGATGNQAD